MIKKEIHVPSGIQYISEWTEYDLPKGRHIIVDKGVTGCGYTEFCLTNKDNVILCSPRKLLLENKSEQHINDENIFYLENIKDKSKNYSDIVNNMYQKISQHIFKCKTLGLPIKFLVTYDSSKYIVDYLLSINFLNDYIFVVDEFQSIFSDAFFKAGVEFNFVDYLKNCLNVIYLSATPALDKYLERVPEFKNLEFQKINWKNSGFVENIKISTKKIKSLNIECENIIFNYLNNNFPIKFINNVIVESKEAVFYLNNVTEIISIIKKCKLLPDQVNIICANTEENTKKLSKLSRKYKELGISLIKKFEIGKIPLKNENNKMFTFCTRCTYIGADFYSNCASTYIFSDPNVNSLVLDISLDLPQIVGRQRDVRNPFKNNIKMFYKIVNKDEENSEENFKRGQYNRTRSTNLLIKGFDNMEIEIQPEYLRKLRNDIDLSKYSKDYVSISEKTGRPIYNEFIELAYERAFEISQKDYQDKITVTKSIENSKLGENLYNLSEEEKNIVYDFLENYFNKVSWFQDKMKLYCEFCDQYSDNSLILNYFYSLVEDSDIYQRYYDYYGTKGCSSRIFIKKRLDEGMKNKTKDDILYEELKKVFKQGDICSLKDIKITLSNIFNKLKITESPKASILNRYFKLKEKRIIDKNTGKQSKGYEIIE